jgi:hypothetical protein
MPMHDVSRWVLNLTLGEGHTPDGGEPWIIPSTDKAIVYEPMELPLREQGIDKVETATGGCVSTERGGEGRKPT